MKRAMVCSLFGRPGDGSRVYGPTRSPTRGLFRKRQAAVRHLVGSAMLGAAAFREDAIYLNITPDNTDGAAVYKLNVQDVPVDGFWSIAVYNGKGYLEPNQYKGYSANNIAAEKNACGSVAVSVRRLRRQDPELLADYAGLELDGAALSSARGSPEPHMKIPGGVARELTSR